MTAALLLLKSDKGTDTGDTGDDAAGGDAGDDAAGGDAAAGGDDAAAGDPP